jgi:c(7)-type cytochrome triheme protein
MKKRTENRRLNSSMTLRRWMQFAVFAAVLLIFGGALVFSAKAKEGIENNPVAPSETKVETVVEAGQDFSKFQHSNPMHARLPCLLCHKRDDNSPAPKFSGHLPCSGCHAQQFAAGNQHPICTICHTATGLKRFPGLKSFNAQFDHATHTRQTNCATCHKPARQGVSLSIPAGGNAHSTCFQCHTPQNEIGGRNIGSCGTCHQLGRLSRTPEWTRAYTATPFSHARHGGGQKLNCASCHTVRAGLARGRQVSAPLASMHFAPTGNAQSCAGCHNNKRAFGGEDFTDCRRCHRANSFRF